MEYNKFGVPAQTVNTKKAGNAETKISDFDDCTIQSIYFSTCGDSVGIQAPEGKCIVITDVIHGSVESSDGTGLELSYKDKSSSNAADRVVFASLAPRTSHSFHTPIMLPPGKFLNLKTGLKATICFYIV